MENCINCREQISAFLDDRLADRDRLALMEHMASCPDCRNYFADQLAIRDALAELEAKAPAGFHQAVMDRVRETKQVQNKTVTFPRWKNWAAMAACCALAILGVVTLGGNREMNLADSQVSYSAGIAQTADDAAESFVYDMSKATTADAPEAPASEDVATDADMAVCDASGAAGTPTDEGSTLPGATEINPSLMVNGRIYTWAAMASSGPPQGFAPQTALRHIGGDVLTEDGQFVAVFAAEGEIYTDPATPDTVYVRITTDWLEDEFVRFTPAE